MTVTTVSTDGYDAGVDGGMAVAPYRRIMTANRKQARPGQEQLILIGVELDPGELVVCRAPTATGKSLGALITAGVRAHESQQRTVIATYTKLLQDQYALRSGDPEHDTDLELAERLFPDVDFKVLKGAQNYLCRVKGKRLTPAQAKATPGAPWLKFLAEEGDPGEVKDRPELKQAAANWRLCGQHKPEDCGYAAAKARARAADVVVTNHALVLINGTNPAVLGPHDLLIVDEVHNLPLAADDFGTEEVRPVRIGGSYEAVQFGERVQAVFGPGPAGADQERRPVLNEIQSMIRFWKKLAPGDQTRLAEVKAWIDAAVDGLRMPHHADRLASVDWKDGDAILRTRLVDIRPVTSLALSPELTIEKKNEEPEEFERAVLLMSATVGTPARPLYAADRLLGEPDLAQVKLSELESPLNYAEQMRISLIAGTGSWGDKVLQLVKDVGGRTLILMRSWRRVSEMYLALDGVVPVQVLIQDQAVPSNNHGLVEAFKKDETSVLIGTRSFFEGIDAPGKTLSQVIIGELPIPMAMSPVQKERQTRMGPVAWREDVVIPQTAMNLEQMIGRLIRAPGDKGLVAILDSAAQSSWGLVAVQQAAAMFGQEPTTRGAAMKWFRG